METIDILRPFVHYGMHFIAPFGLAWLFFRKNKWKAYFIMMATMLIDLDHLMATPVFDPQRCSIGFHLFHSFPLTAGYVAMLFFPKTRIVGIGLTFHIFTDWVDCLWL